MYSKRKTLKFSVTTVFTLFLILAWYHEWLASPGDRAIALRRISESAVFVPFQKLTLTISKLWLSLKQ
jgi:hypothetical protein